MNDCVTQTKKMVPHALVMLGVALTATAFVACERSRPNPPAQATTTSRNNGAADNPHAMPNDDQHTSGGMTNAGADPTSQAEPPDDPTVARFLSLRAPKPKTWIWHPPRSSMRRGNWTVPGRDGHDAAEVIVFYFGAEKGGSVEENINRWGRQFREPGGEPGSVQPEVSTMTVDGMPVTLAEYEGEWMPMGAVSFQKNQKALFAIVESPDGKVFIRFGGPAATYDANRDDVMRMISGIKIVDE